MNIVFVEVQGWEKELLAKRFPEATFSEEKLTPETVGQYQDADILSCFIYSPISKEVLEKLPHLKYISIRSTGFDSIDIAACKERGITVSNVPEYGSNTVAEFTFALLLDLTRKVTQAVTQAKQMNFNHPSLRGVDLYGKTIGIIGLGKIGIQVLQIAKGFGMHVVVYNHSQDRELAQTVGFVYADLETLIKTADIVTLHVPLMKETQHIINKENIEHFKKGSFLINTARGGLIDTQAIVLGLEKEILAGVALDVLEGENELNEEVAILNTESQSMESLKTLLYDHLLLNHPKVLITPHNAFNSQEALMKILTITMQNIDCFLNKIPQNIVL